MEIAKMDEELCLIMHHSFEHMPYLKIVPNHLHRFLIPKGCILIPISTDDYTSCHKYKEYRTDLDVLLRFFIHNRKSMNILFDNMVCDSALYQFVKNDKYLKWGSTNSPDSVFKKSDLIKFDREAEN